MSEVKSIGDIKINPNTEVIVTAGALIYAVSLIAPVFTALQKVFRSGDDSVKESLVKLATLTVHLLKMFPQPAGDQLLKKLCEETGLPYEEIKKY